jgi:16S rRNA (guanine527-N7)-methyltransferase
VSFSSREELVRRHLVESLAARDVVDHAGGPLLDIGSGAGLPGVPLLISSGVDGWLLEPRFKRWTFLRTVIRELALGSKVVRARFEELPDGERRYGVITARGVGRHREVARWAQLRLKREGVLVIWTNEERGSVLEDLEGWRVLSSPLPGTGRGRLIQLRPCFT